MSRVKSVSVCVEINNLLAESRLTRKKKVQDKVRLAASVVYINFFGSECVRVSVFASARN